jgi:hypothetical protein
MKNPSGEAGTFYSFLFSFVLFVLFVVKSQFVLKTGSTTKDTPTPEQTVKEKLNCRHI